MMIKCMMNPLIIYRKQSRKFDKPARNPSVTQNGGKIAPIYFHGDRKKKPNTGPTNKSPVIFATAKPSTLLLARLAKIIA